MRTLLLVLGVCLTSVSSLAAAPTNDAVGRAVRVDVLPFVHAMDTRTATTAAADPHCVGQGPTVWYTFTPPEDVRIDVNTFGSNYDTTLSAYIVDSAGAAQIACNDDTNGLQSQLQVNLIAGVTYTFMVGAYASGPGGDLVIAFSERHAGSRIFINTRAALRSPGLVTLRGTVTCDQPSIIYVWGTIVQALNGAGDHHAADATWAQFATEGTSCNRRSAWTSNPIPIENLFRRGPAVVTATMTVCTETSCDSHPISARIMVERTAAAERYSADEQGRGRRHQRRAAKASSR